MLPGQVEAAKEQLLDLLAIQAESFSPAVVVEVEALVLAVMNKLLSLQRAVNMEAVLVAVPVPVL